jgi:chromosome segregation ATPase
LKQHKPRYGDRLSKLERPYDRLSTTQATLATQDKIQKQRLEDLDAKIVLLTGLKDNAMTDLTSSEQESLKFRKELELCTTDNENLRISITRIEEEKHSLKTTLTERTTEIEGLKVCFMEYGTDHLLMPVCSYNIVASRRTSWNLVESLIAT